MGILLYPYFLVLFWYKDFVLTSARICFGIFVYTADLLSVPLLLKTFFKPLKGEYRDGLVLFSIVMGILIKTILLIVSLIILLILVLILLVLCAVILLLPLILIMFLIKK